MKKIYEYNEINNIFSIDGICFFCITSFSYIIEYYLRQKILKNFSLL